jgi:hypothetical protein
MTTFMASGIISAVAELPPQLGELACDGMCIWWDEMNRRIALPAAVASLAAGASRTTAQTGYTLIVQHAVYYNVATPSAPASKSATIGTS